MELLTSLHALLNPLPLLCWGGSSYATGQACMLLQKAQFVDCSVHDSPPTVARLIILCKRWVLKAVCLIHFPLNSNNFLCIDKFERKVHQKQNSNQPIAVQVLSTIFVHGRDSGRPWLHFRPWLCLFIIRFCRLPRNENELRCKIFKLMIHKLCLLFWLNSHPGTNYNSS